MFVWVVWVSDVHCKVLCAFFSVFYTVRLLVPKIAWSISQALLESFTEQGCFILSVKAWFLKWEDITRCFVEFHTLVFLPRIIKENSIGAV